MRGVVAALIGLLWGGTAFAGIPAAINQTPPAHDAANAVISGSITANTACSATPSSSTAGCSAMFSAWGSFNVVFGGSSGPNGSYSATLEIDRSFDGGTTWYVAGVGGTGTQAIYSTPNQDVSVVVKEPEQWVLYRLRCTAYTSGTINYRLSTTGGTATTFNPH